MFGGSFVPSVTPPQPSRRPRWRRRPPINMIVTISVRMDRERATAVSAYGFQKARA